MPPPTPSRSRSAKLLGIMGLWLVVGIAAALTTRISEWNFEPWQAQSMLVGAFLVVPIALPLTLVILRGWRIIPWLIAGAVLVEGIAIRLSYTEFARTTAPLRERFVMALIVAGVGACWLGCWVSAVSAIREERWPAAAGWGAGGVLATMSLGVILMLARAG